LQNRVFLAFIWLSLALWAYKGEPLAYLFMAVLAALHIGYVAGRANQS
jgi:hypothetical protein